MASADYYLDFTQLALTFLGIIHANTRLPQPKKLLLAVILILWAYELTLIKLLHIVSSISKLEKTKLSQDNLCKNSENNSS
jgi:hypothetical protein